MFTSLPQPSEWSGGFAWFLRRSVVSIWTSPPGGLRHTVCPATIWIWHYAVIIEKKMSASKLEYGGTLEFLVISWSCFLLCINSNDPAVVLCHTSGSPHPEGPWGCDASYCLKQLPNHSVQPLINWWTNQFFLRFSTFLNEVTSKKKSHHKRSLQVCLLHCYITYCLPVLCFTINFPLTTTDDWNWHQSLVNHSSVQLQLYINPVPEISVSLHLRPQLPGIDGHWPSCFTLPQTSRNKWTGNTQLHTAYFVFLPPFWKPNWTRKIPMAQKGCEWMENA